MGELLCEAVDVRSGQKVLDVATGSGNTAISAARRFCEATGIDYVPNLIEQAKHSSATVGVGGTNPYTETFTTQPKSQLRATCPM
jgi:ubiquinone/menaquinone biosynthesis C-methylase UbiE